MDPLLEHGLVAAMKDEVGGHFGTQAEAATMPEGSVKALSVNSIFSQFYQHIVGKQQTHIKREDLRKVTEADGDKVTIFVKRLTGEVIEIACSGLKETVATLKLRIQDKENIPPDQQRIFFAGKQMSDSSTLLDYNVADKSTLQLLLRFKGSDFFFYYTDPYFLHARFDYDFSDVLYDNEVFYRGGKQYHRPLGSKRYAIRVLGQYEDDKWLGEGGMRTASSADEWPVAYHGSMESRSGPIVQNGGVGIYCTPNPQVALAYGHDFTFNGRRYQLIFQTRVDPSVLKVLKADGVDGAAGEYWLVPNGDHIRPYGICVFPMEFADD
ncbi:hypothetical protein AAVH_05767 [Aphelenchoides avenae]|nr:hypothetical protein AAVH_05767 [Aphelenchus avenae]